MDVAEYINDFFSQLFHKKPCANCEYLKNQIEIERREKNKILNLLIESRQPEEKVIVSEEPIDYKPISPSVPWRVRAQQMTHESFNKKEKTDA
jgi:hypothetical protein